jgi:hypothetical protein
MQGADFKKSNALSISWNEILTHDNKIGKAAFHNAAYKIPDGVALQFITLTCCRLTSGISAKHKMY